MTDITKCNDPNCPIRLRCYRYMAKDGVRQSYGEFKYRDGCHYFWDNGSYPICRTGATHTSRESYQRVHFKRALNTSQKMVLECIRQCEPICIAEIAKIMNLDKSSVSARVNELIKKLEIVTLPETRRCSITGKNVHYYKVLGK